MNAPKLRFKEFRNDWESKLFEELYSIKNGLNKEKEAFGSGTPILNYMDVNKNTFIDIHEIKGKVNLTASEIERFLVKNNDLFFTRTSESSEEIGLTCSYIGDDTNLVFSGFVLKASPKIKGIDSTFYSYYLRTFNKRKEIIKHSSITTRALTSGTLLSSMAINFTTIEEQKKIAKFLKKMDFKIKLQQGKIELLKEQKKGYMLKIFSQELRFKDNNGQEYANWDSKTLRDIINVHSGRDYKHLDIGNIPVYGTGGYMLSVNEALSETDAIGIGRKGTINQPQKLKAPFWTVDTLFYCIPKKSNDLDFLFLLFQQINWKKYDESTGVPSLSKKTIESIICDIPSYEEQQMIGSLFKKIDKKIKLESFKLAELQKQKQAFLQQMFI